MTTLTATTTETQARFTDCADRCNISQQCQCAYDSEYSPCADADYTEDERCLCADCCDVRDAHNAD